MEYSLGDLRPTLDETTTADEGRRDFRPDRSRTHYDREGEGNAPPLHPLDRNERLFLSYHSRLFPGASQPPFSPPRQSPFVSLPARQHVDRDPDDDEARLLPRDQDAGPGSPGSLKSSLTRLVRPMSLVSLQSPPQLQLGAPLPPRRRAAKAILPGWNPSSNMYLFFAFGLACAIGHHVYYSRLDGKPAADQLQMLRYGMALSFAAKAGLSAAVLVAFHQRIWMTVRTRLLSVAAVDALFSATEDLAAFLSREMIRNAKVAAGLAVFIW